MTDDSFFRWIALAGFVVGGSIGMYHRLRANTGEKLARREEGLFILLTLRPLAAVFTCGMIAYLISPAWIAWGALPLPVWLRWCGVALGIANLFLLWWVFHTLGKNITDTVVTRREHTLVTGGPYRFVRHPFYMAALLGIVALTVMSSNWYFLMAGGVLFTLLAWRTPTEEAKLIERFGDEYRKYMRRTGRFVPRVFGNRP
jgi:protein-S-isoprenylcysteine O-methyltransferase Ste14